jgi:hypothetical protein
MKIRRVGAELFHEDGQTDGRTGGQIDMTKLIVAFRNFAKAPKGLTPPILILIIDGNLKTLVSLILPLFQ